MEKKIRKFEKAFWVLPKSLRFFDHGRISA